MIQYPRREGSGLRKGMELPMCDYSLQHVASRPAKAGDKLVSTRFHGSVTRGFADASDPDTAVCLLPGTEVAFDRSVEFEPRFALFPRRKVADRVARFRQIDMDKPSTHHDALEFPNGQIVLLTRLVEGQTVTVLQMPATPHVREKVVEAAAPGSPTRWRLPEPTR
jgi:hypothetical protein